MNVDYCWWVKWKKMGKGNVYVHVSTHLIRIMFQWAIVAHVSHSIQICVSLVNVVDIGTVVLFIQYACGINRNVT